MHQRQIVHARAKRVLRHMLHVREYAALTRWRVFVHEATANRGRMNLVVRRLRHLTMAAGFSGWCTVVHQHIIQRARLRRALSAALSRYLRRALSGWVWALSERRRVYACMARVVAKVQHGELSRALGRWLELIDHARIAKRCIVVLQQHKAYRALHGWQAQHRVRQRVLARASGAVRRMLRVKEFITFAAWRRETADRRRRRCLLRLSVTRISHHQVASAFRTWLDLCGQRRVSRQALSRMRTYTLARAIRG